jgi:hypothetical protein
MVLLGLVTLIFGYHLGHHSGFAAKQSSEEQPAGLPWNGGKPTAPVRVRSDLEAPIAIHQDVPFRIFIKVDRPCRELVVRLRGLDGLQLVGNELPQSLGPCTTADEVSVEVVVRLSQQVSAYLAVDLTLLGVEGWSGDPDLGTSQLIAVVAQGSSSKPQQSLGKMLDPSKSGIDSPVVELGTPANSP